MLAIERLHLGLAERLERQRQEHTEEMARIASAAEESHRQTMASITACGIAIMSIFVAAQIVAAFVMPLTLKVLGVIH
jgi:hypothetical protein